MPNPVIELVFIQQPAVVMDMQVVGNRGPRGEPGPPGPPGGEPIDAPDWVLIFENGLI